MKMESKCDLLKNELDAISAMNKANKISTSNSNDVFSKTINHETDTEQVFKVRLSLDEKIKCLEEISAKLNKILYVYEKSQEPNSNYNYKVYCGGILIYVSSSNMLFDGELISVVVNLNAIINNDFDKPRLKRIIFESKNQVEYILSNYRETLDEVSDNASI